MNRVIRKKLSYRSETTPFTSEFHDMAVDIESTSELVLSTISKRTRIEASIMAKFRYRNETILFIINFLKIEVKRTELGLDCLKIEAKQRN